MQGNSDLACVCTGENPSGIREICRLCKEVSDSLKAAGIRVETDDRMRSWDTRSAALRWKVPYMLIVGEKRLEEKQCQSVRETKATLEA